VSRVFLTALCLLIAFALGSGFGGAAPNHVEKLHNLITENAALKLELKRERKLKGKAQAGRTYWRRGALKARRVFKASLTDSAVGAHPYEVAFSCIHRFEGRWTDPNPPYWGGLQMDRSFYTTYGDWAAQAFGTPDRWPVSVQMAVAIRALTSGRGFYPWPNTARMCGLL
jgi:hypothetical protein